MRRLPTIAVLSAATIGLAACGQPASDATDNAAAPTTATADAQPPAPAQAAATTGTANLWAGGEQRPLDIQSAHVNGVVLQLTSLQSRPMETAIGIRVVNGRDREVNLNQFNNRNGYIVLDNGERLYLSPPANNTRVSIPAGQTLEGELVFLGRLPPVNSAVLIINDGSSTDNRFTTSPGFRIDLPLSAATS